MRRPKKVLFLLSELKDLSTGFEWWKNMSEFNEEEITNLLNVCANCGYSSYEDDEFTVIDGNLYCEGCFERCDVCGHASLLLVETQNDGRVCEYCREYYIPCELCGDLIHEDGIRMHRGRYLCVYCYDDLPNGYIRDYHDNPSLICRSMDDSEDMRSYWSTDLNLLGIEMEMQEGDIDLCAAQLSDLLDEETLGYLMHDGSLDNGIEVVSMPMTRDFFDRKYPLTDICRIAKETAMKAHDPDEPGLHIHLSWSWFGDDLNEQKNTLLKCVYLLDKYRDFWETISRRSDYSFERWCEPYHLAYWRDYDELERLNNHYKILNFRRHTIELRVFKGSIVENTIRTSIDIYIGLVDLCRSHSFEIIETISLKDLVSYLSLSERSEKYIKKWLKYDFEINKGIKLKLDFAEEFLKIKAKMKLNYFNQEYTALDPRIEEHIDPLYGYTEIRVYPCIPDVFSGNPVNIHFMGINPQNNGYTECM